MKITGRAELEKTGKESSTQPDTQLPRPAAFRTQKAPLGISLGGWRYLLRRRVLVHSQRLGAGSRREAAMHLDLGMAREFFLFYLNNKEKLKSHVMS